MPAGAEGGILKGLYLLRAGPDSGGPRVQLMGAGTILREVLAAAELLEQDWGISADVWSATSFSELRRDGLEATRWNLLHPESPPSLSYVERCLQDRRGPVIAASDYMKIVADQIRAFVSRRFEVLGTDGFGRSDTRERLRAFFEVNRHWVVLAALQALAADGEIPRARAAEAIAKYGIDPTKPSPVKV
jgi:pyruvate dehydrogenase E1 component